MSLTGINVEVAGSGVHERAARRSAAATVLIFMGVRK